MGGRASHVALWLVVCWAESKGVDTGGSREPHQKPEKEDLCHSERAPGRKCRETADPEAGLLKCEVPLYALSRDRTWDMGAETR